MRVAQWLERGHDKVKYTGSNPVLPSLLIEGVLFSFLRGTVTVDWLGSTRHWITV